VLRVKLVIPELTLLFLVFLSKLKGVCNLDFLKDLEEKLLLSLFEEKVLIENPLLELRGEELQLASSSNCLGGGCVRKTGSLSLTYKS